MSFITGISQIADRVLMLGFDQNRWRDLVNQSGRFLPTSRFSSTNGNFTFADLCNASEKYNLCKYMKSIANFGLNPQGGYYRTGLSNQNSELTWSHSWAFGRPKMSKIGQFEINWCFLSTKNEKFSFVENQPMKVLSVAASQRYI